ncbi:hypothetical protein TNCV_2971521 [Trichonephila clavipes]|nr:hypothetical protein TNCV_2971521 [Trichonephila clavipes]
MKADENVVHQNVGITFNNKLGITLNAFDTVLLLPCDEGETLSLTAERTCSSSHIHITAAVSDTVKTIGRKEKRKMHHYITYCSDLLSLRNQLFIHYANLYESNGSVAPHSKRREICLHFLAVRQVELSC